MACAVGYGEYLRQEGRLGLPLTEDETKLHALAIFPSVDVNNLHDLLLILLESAMKSPPPADSRKFVLRRR